MAKAKSKSKKVSKVSKGDIHSGLFAGRLNRSGFVIGIVTVAVISILLGIIFTPLFQKISNRFVLVFVSVLILSFTFYNVSFTLRRLHDLNKSSLWLLVFLPGLLLILLATAEGISSGIFGAKYPMTQTLFSITNAKNSIVGLLGLISAVANLSYIYLVSAPGYKKTNKWGPPSTHWKVKEILGWK